MKFKELQPRLSEHLNVLGASLPFLGGTCESDVVRRYEEGLSRFHEAMNSTFDRGQYRRDPDAFIEQDVPDGIVELFESLDLLYGEAREALSQDFGACGVKLFTKEGDYVIN
ncbi:hypothetical protein CMI48_02790 [Candidatus Pacearchaeota archaeon]|jgi:hypothetical protein|nr:hypothetical protein [Candidatus Pacearchaeota archaeon]|tara:strand:- start:1426 stop:1761 length:336 start_codon:yes stop_codon:yes gene_type:complete